MKRERDKTFSNETVTRSFLQMDDHVFRVSRSALLIAMQLANNMRKIEMNESDTHSAYRVSVGEAAISALPLVSFCAFAFPLSDSPLNHLLT